MIGARLIVVHGERLDQGSTVGLVVGETVRWDMGGLC